MPRYWRPVSGLKTKFRGKVRVVVLGRRLIIRGKNLYYDLELKESDIEPEDIETPTAS